METRTAEKDRSPRTFVVLSATLVLYGNAAAYADRVLFPGAWPFAAVMGLLVTVLLIAWARWGAGLAWRELGLEGVRRSLHGVAFGLVLGATLAAAALGSIRLVSAPWGGIAYPPLASAEAGQIAWRLLVTMPLDTIVLEEVAFRGVLLALALRLYPSSPPTPAPGSAGGAPRPRLPGGAGRAVVVSSAVFMVWHVMVNYDTLANTTLAESTPLMMTGVVLAHLGVWIGGILFCLVRLRMGGLPAAVVTHWVANTGILLGFRSV